MTRKLVLASSSPRRRRLLEELGLQFDVRPVDVDESANDDESPARYVERLAQVKARAEARAGELIVGADTIVVLERRLLGKPSDAEEAREMLHCLAGREHTVLATGEPLDKAGAYAIQGLGALFVDAVEGNYTNVVGLPLPLTYRLLAKSGFDLRGLLQGPK
jgi:septum formation protein